MIHPIFAVTVAASFFVGTSDAQEATLLEQNDIIAQFHDLNNDGKISARETADQVYAHLQQLIFSPDNHNISSRDVVIQYAKSLCADLDGNGIISASDFFVAVSGATRDHATIFDGDLNADGIVGHDDLTLVLQAQGKSVALTDVQALNFVQDLLQARISGYTAPKASPEPNDDHDAPEPLHRERAATTHPRQHAARRMAAARRG
ncbi:MAG: hypothetical protein AAF108_07875 [Planctomycetota bacterium]